MSYYRRDAVFCRKRPALTLLWLALMVSLQTTRPQQAAKSMITIRGGGLVERLPLAYMRSVSVHTFEPGTSVFSRVEDDLTEGEGEGFVNPTSFSELYLPADLPLPRARPALGVCIANGVPRYIMPSVVLSLETPDRVWRNRGACSLPRASVWIDTFASNAAPALAKLQLSAFGQSIPDVRFLEDIDGAASYTPLLFAAVPGGPSAGASSLLRPHDPASLPVASALEALKNALRSLPSSNPALSAFFNEGFHFVDIPLQDGVLMQVPRLKLRMFLADFDKPQRLLEVTDSADLDGEPLGELDIAVVPASAGRDSEFLPECYENLYDEGNLIFTQ